MDFRDFEENRFGYLRNLSQEELKEIIRECENDMELYEEAEGEVKSSLEGDRNLAEDILQFIDKNNLINKKTL